MMNGAASDKHAAARQHQRYRSRNEEGSSSLLGRRRRDDDASPDRKRSRREIASYYHRDVRTGSSSSIGPSSSATTIGADARRCDRDNAYRAAKKKPESNEIERNRAREDMTRKSISSGASSRPEQRARTSRPCATQRHQLAAAVDDRKPTPEEVEAAEAARRLDIQRRREEARREMDRMVKTVEFNDPFISPLDVFKPRAH